MIISDRCADLVSVSWCERQFVFAQWNLIGLNAPLNLESAVNYAALQLSRRCYTESSCARSVRSSIVRPSVLRPFVSQSTDISFIVWFVLFRLVSSRLVSSVMFTRLVLFVLRSTLIFPATRSCFSFHIILLGHACTPGHSNTPDLLLL